jgi:ribosomal protein S18 acetylase RimI-like enzyme
MLAEYGIRPARAGDLDRLAGMQLALQDHLEAANPGLWRMTPEARAQVKGQLSGRLRAAGSRALVAEHARDGVIGVIYGRVATNASYLPQRTGVVDQLYVEPEHRRRGVGRRLMAALCGFFEQEQVDDVSLRYVVGNEEAAAFWTALGFTPRIVTAGAARAVVISHL